MYLITITKKETVIEPVSEWKKTSDEPSIDEDGKRSKDTYGYVTNEIPVKKESTVYQQLVDNLDLVRVIAAVNHKDDSIDRVLRDIEENNYESLKGNS